MNRIHLLVNRSTFVVLFTGLLSASALRAQTFNGREKLTELPAQLEAAVYPLTHAPTTINVIFNNRTGERIWVEIKSQTGETLYSAFETTTLYRRNFDLSELPAGRYTVELSKRHEHYTQEFAIAPPRRRYVTIGHQLPKQTLDRPVDTTLIVSQ